MSKKLRLPALSIAILCVTGCASMQTAIEHKDLAVSSQQSESIFLDPVPKSQMTVHVSIKNTTDQDLSIEKQIKKAISADGYRVVSNPNNAHFILQANILSVGTMKISAAKASLAHGYGSALTSGLASGVAVNAITGSSQGALVGGIIGGLVSTAADSLVKDVNYTMITDIQISERVKHAINEKTQANLTNGSSTQTQQSSSKKSHFQRYRTRVISNADKVNLKFAEARPALEQGLRKVISGIF